MSDIGNFQDKVNDILDPGFHFQVDRPHAGKPIHVDLTRTLPEVGGADKVEVGFNGNVRGGTTQIGPISMPWQP